MSGWAAAAIPSEVGDALAALQEDALTVAGTILAAIVAVYAFKFILKGISGSGSGGGTTWSGPTAGADRYRDPNTPF